MVSIISTVTLVFMLKNYDIFTYLKYIDGFRSLEIILLKCVEG